MDSRSDASNLLIVLAPLLALGAFTAVLGALAGLAGWYRTEMLGIAAVAAGLVTIGAGVLFYRQTRERRASAQALANVEARVAAIVDSAMDAVITTDESQRIVLYNAAAERVFRWPRSAVIGQPLDMLLPERLRAAHRRHVEQFGHTGVTSRSMGHQSVLVGLRANGEEFPIEASISQLEESGSQAGDGRGRKLFTVILRDVTERRRAEDLLARSEARLRGILDSAMDAIITVDESQHIVLFNKAAEGVFGCPREEAIGAPLAWFIPERFRHQHDRYVREFGETGTTSRRMGALRIVTGLRRNGEEFPIDASISQVEENGAKFYTVILRDVTARVRAEQELERSKAELQELATASNSVREQEKRRIARELHDELAQALTALKMDVTWLRDRMPARDAQGAAQVTDKLAAMQKMLDATVAATRRISADLRPLLLDDLGLVPAVEWLVQSFTQRSGIECELAIGPELELGEPHATALFRILQESLTNVARHSGASRAEVSLDVEGELITLTVRDNGRGFSTADPRKPDSYGLLGLRERAYLLGGDTRIEAQPGRGVTVETRIPCPQREPA